MIEIVRRVQLNSILGGVRLKMWNYSKMIMDADFALLSYGVKLHEDCESDEGY